MNYSGLFYDDVLNGEGVRVALFLSGCSHNCPGCYNQDALDPAYGQEFTPEVLEEILKYMEQPHVAGITLSGGDPMFAGNLEGTVKIINAVRAKFGYTKDIWLWTGYTMEEVEHQGGRQGALRRAILNEVDTFIDGRFIEEEKDLTLKWRGSANQRVFTKNEDGLLIQLYKEEEL